jgi:hypothetical protein
LQCIPDVSYSFETYANTYFTFDYTPHEVVQLMEVIDRIPLPKHGTDDERIEWLRRRGTVISTFNNEWRERINRKEHSEEDKKQRKIFRDHCVAEAYDLHVNQRATYGEILDLWRSTFGDHKFYSALPQNGKSLEAAVRRYTNDLKNKGAT